MSEPILLPARLDAKELSTFAPTLTEACTGGQVCLDASEVTHMGALATQLIIAAARAQNAQGGTLEISAISDRATSQLGMMGLTPEQLSEGAP